MTTYRLIRSGPMALWLLAGFLVLSVMDCATTVWLLHRGAIEINPFMQILLRRGVLAFWVGKMLIAFGACCVLEAAYLRNRILGFRVIAGVYTLQAIVVFLNVLAAGRIS